MIATRLKSSGPRMVGTSLPWRTAIITTRSSPPSKLWRGPCGPPPDDCHWPHAEGPGRCRGRQDPGYGDQLISYSSQPRTLCANSEYFVALAETFEKQYDVAFQGIRQGPSPISVSVCSNSRPISTSSCPARSQWVGDWLADRLVAIAETLQDDLPLRIQTQRDPSGCAPARGQSPG